MRRLGLVVLLSACGSSPSHAPDAAGADAVVDAPGPVVDARPDSLVYAHSGTHLYRIDTRTNQPVDIGAFTNIGTQTITDIAVDKDGKMVGITLNKLYSIDVSTAAATLIKDLGVSAQNFTSLSYVPTDFNDPNSVEILVAASTKGAVYQIDPTTGNATLLGNYGKDSQNRQIGSSGDIVAVRGLGILATVNLGTTLTDPDYLATVDPTTWTATPLPQTTTYDRIFGLAFWGGTVYGFVDDAAMPAGKGSVISIDPKTGASTLLQSDVIGWYGAGVTTNAPIVN
jgi:hypothetical protein